MGTKPIIKVTLSHLDNSWLHNHISYGKSPSTIEKVVKLIPV